MWHGCGSLPSERQAALEYARSLSGDPNSIIELNEGDNDDDEMFWMMLGDDDHAKAQYWKWRPDAVNVDPRVWIVEQGAKDKVCASFAFVYFILNFMSRFALFPL